MRAIRKNLKKREEAGEELLATLKSLANGGQWSLGEKGAGRWRGQEWWWVREEGGIRWRLLESEGLPSAWEQMDFPLIEGDGRDAILPSRYEAGIVLETIYTAVKRDVGGELLRIAFDTLSIEPFTPASLEGDEAWELWKELSPRLEGRDEDRSIQEVALGHLIAALEEVF